jgi:hypothetical protein
MRGLVGQHPDGLKAGGEEQKESQRSNAGSEAEIVKKMVLKSGNMAKNKKIKKVPLGR